MNGLNTNLLPLVTEKFISAAPAAAAKMLDMLATHEAILLLKPLKVEQLVACLNQMDTSKAAAVLRRFPSRQAAHVLSKLSLPKAAQIYQAFSIPQREKMKTLLEAAWVALLEKGNQWPAGSAGAQMSRDFVVFKTENTVAQIIEKLKNMPRKKLPVVCLVCSGKEEKFKGIIRTAELAFFAANSLAGSVMSETKSVLVTAPVAQAQERLQAGQGLVPVISETGTVLGVLRPEDLMMPASAHKKRFGWF